MSIRRSPNASGGRRPSMLDVARMAGVSHQTVSRVINGSPDVAPETRARVRKAIDTLGYQPNNTARALASHRTRTIAVVAGGLWRPRSVDMLAAASATARAHALFTTVSLVDADLCTDADMVGLCDDFSQQGVDALVVLAPTDVMVRAVCRLDTPLPRVIVTSTHGQASLRDMMSSMREESRRRSAVVGGDDWGAMAQVVRLVIGYGHRSALYFAGPRGWRGSTTRLLAWRTLTAEVSLPNVVVPGNSWDAGEAYARMNHALERIGSSGGAVPTVVVTSSDGQAMGAARALHEHGLRIPQDVSLVGFGDYPAMAAMMPPLSTLRPDFAQIGSAALREAVWLLGGGPEVGYAASVHGAGLIPATMVRRASLGRVPRV
ncbi:LacI family DNA-binding transcriptional regulator [uncultured Bifidobacterium sp.]|uniref:LacI family DNA-binding transcriptional regulator n=1 Tax=uncultured Bifidobacterium sp. TaxID=165187 RepID=UPI0028DC767B|nr:LacI family DNA-binding transcriptional regulator [uncultured Bifidobacterium sp.]